MRMILLPIHIIAGLTAIVAGFVALYAPKGAKLHRKIGLVFVYSMLVMAVAATTLAIMKHQMGNVVGGSLTFYMVTTALITVRRHDHEFHLIDAGAFVMAVAIGVLAIRFGFAVLNSPTGLIDGEPATPGFVLGGITLLAASGDLRMMLGRGLDGVHRITRHLWRMCLAMFIATGSFFLGQAKVFPKPLRIFPLLALPVLAVLITMAYWAWRVRFRRTVRGLVLSTRVDHPPNPQMRYPIGSFGLLFAALAVASSAFAQSIDHAKQLFDGAKYAEAKIELLALQKANDRSAATAYYLGRIAMFDNDGDEAIHQFERAVQLEDGKALYHVWLGTALGDAAGRASPFQQPFLARRVMSEWERAVALDPNQIDARFNLAQFYAMAPALMGGGIDKAREQAGEITKRSPMRGAMARGMIEEHEKNAAAAEAAYQQAIAAVPDSSAGYFALSNTYARGGKAAEAFATLDQYVKRHPEDRWVLYHTGRTSGVTGQQLDRGEAALQQFLAKPPLDAHAANMANAHYWLGQIAEKRGAKDAAREQYQTALRINPKSQLSQRALDALK